MAARLRQDPTREASAMAMAMVTLAEGVRIVNDTRLGRWDWDWRMVSEEQPSMDLGGGGG